MSFSRYFLSIAIIVCAISFSAKADVFEDSKVIGISGGEDHTFVLSKNGGAWSCGNNGWLQLGIDGDYNNQYFLVPVHDGDMNTYSTYLENIISVKAGWKHSLALDVNKCVWAWGDNRYGELGNGTTDNHSTPIKVRNSDNNDFLKDINTISAGRSGEFSLALDISKNVWAWGLNTDGQLGNGNFNDRALVPVAVFAGEQDANNQYNQLINIVEISAGEKHSVACDSDGFVYAWGRNRLDLGFEHGGSEYGRLGNGTTIEHYNMPLRVFAGEQKPSEPNSPLKNIVSVAAGWEHTLALEKLNPADPNCRGRVYAWGNNKINYNDGGGQLGNGTTDNNDRPVFVHAGEQNPSNPDSNFEGIIAISAGDGHSIALDQNGFVWAWGGNLYGQLGNGDDNEIRLYKTRPVKVIKYNNQPLSGIKTISAGYWHNLAIDNNGILWVWGNQDLGRLGLGDTPQRNRAFPRPPVLNITQNSFQFGIQKAINDANNSDVLELVPYIYFEQDVNLGINSVTLQSIDPYNWGIVGKTIIQGKGDQTPNTAILKFNSNSTISGLTLCNSDLGVWVQSLSPHIDNCVITDCNVEGVYINPNSSPEISGCKIFSNTSDGILNSGGSANIFDNWIYDNGRMGIYFYYCTGSLNVLRNRIYDNFSHGICDYNCSGPSTIANNWIYDNNQYGLFISNSTGTSTVRNNTVVGNTQYGIARSGGSIFVVKSSIFRNNSYGALNGCTQNYCWLDSNGNPNFIDAASKNFHLDINSPCKDMGDPAYKDYNDTDIDDEPRIYNGRVDIGADEIYTLEIDYDENGIINFNDYAIWVSYWEVNDINANLDGDSDVDVNDLDIFCDYWLWTAPWSPNYGMQSQGQEDGFQMSGGDEQSSNTDATTDGQTVTDFTDDSMNNDMEDNENQMPEGPIAVWLVYDGNMTPSYGEEITVYIHSDANLMIMDLIANVAGDAEITSAMSEEDCNNFGWDNGWGSDPYIDPSGWVEVFSLSSSAFFEGKLVNGTVGYFKFRYYSGQVNVSIATNSCIVDNNLEGVSFSTDPLIFGHDPNE